MHTAAKRGRMVLGLSAVLGLGLLAVDLKPAAAEPPSHAKAHGYRRKHDSYNARYSPSRHRSSGSYRSGSRYNDRYSGSRYNDRYSGSRYNDRYSGSRYKDRYDDRYTGSRYNDRYSDYDDDRYSRSSRYGSRGGYDARADYDPRDRFEPHG